MNTTISIFRISDQLELTIVIPDIKNKENRFYPAAEVLHKFDIVEVLLSSNTQRYTLACDDIQEIVACLYGTLHNTLRNNNNLPKDVSVRQFGRYINIQLYNDSWNEKNAITDFNHYRVFAHKDLETWMYSFKDNVYIEFSYSYPQSFDESGMKESRAEINKEFEEYIASYEPLFFANISHEMAQEWLIKCKKIIRDIDSGYIIDKAIMD